MSRFRKARDFIALVTCFNESSSQFSPSLRQRGHPQAHVAALCLGVEKKGCPFIEGKLIHRYVVRPNLNQLIERRLEVEEGLPRYRENEIQTHTWKPTLKRPLRNEPALFIIVVSTKDMKEVFFVLPATRY